MKEQIQLITGYFWIAMTLVLMLLVLSGCATKTEWYENGQVKSHREGFIDWSEGAGKQMPLSNIDISGVGVGK